MSVSQKFREVCRAPDHTQIPNRFGKNDDPPGSDSEHKDDRRRHGEPERAREQRERLKREVRELDAYEKQREETARIYKKAARERLGLLSTAEPDEEEITAAYRKAALVAHPDKGGSAEAFRSVKNAARVLRGEVSLEELVKARKRIAESRACQGPASMETPTCAKCYRAACGGCRSDGPARAARRASPASKPSDPDGSASKPSDPSDKPPQKQNKAGVDANRSSSPEQKDGPPRRRDGTKVDRKRRDTRRRDANKQAGAEATGGAKEDRTPQ